MIRTHLTYYPWVISFWELAAWHFQLFLWTWNDKYSCRWPCYLLPELVGESETDETIVNDKHRVCHNSPLRQMKVRADSQLIWSESRNYKAWWCVSSGQLGTIGQIRNEWYFASDKQGRSQVYFILEKVPSRKKQKISWRRP